MLLINRKIGMRKNIIITLFIISLIVSVLQTALSQEITGFDQGEDSKLPREKLKAAIDLIIQGKYDHAAAFAESNVKDSLAVRFILISASYARLGELETSEGQHEFFNAIDIIENIAKNRLNHNSNDLATLFYYGSALCYRSVIHRTNGNVWKAFSDVRAGKKLLEQCLRLSPEFTAPHLLLGSYTYWISKVNILRFVPFVPDNRKKGIEKIVAYVNPQSISYAMSLNQLFWIYMDRKQFDEAEAVVLKGLELYPESRFFLYPAANLAEKKEEWEKAAGFFASVYDSLVKDGFANRYMALKVRVKQAESYVQIKKFKEAVLLCAEMSTMLAIPSEQKKSDSLFKRAQKIVSRYSACANDN